MKRIFIGPSLPKRFHLPFEARIEFCGPAGQGDIAAAVLERVSVLGIIDGLFEDRAAVWHKEILFALAQGVRVFGGASMGALRAAECGTFGMIGVGTIFHSYAEGQLVDDDAVAQIHAPAELGYAALSEPLVNILATCEAALAAGLISQEEAAGIGHAAKHTFFKERSYDRAVAAAASVLPARKDAVLTALQQHHCDLKAQDALELLRRVDAAPDARLAEAPSWEFIETRVWRRVMQARFASVSGAGGAEAFANDLQQASGGAVLDRKADETGHFRNAEAELSP
jgi:hypothetical protein